MENKSFVYNSGNVTEQNGFVNLFYGVFIDGTLNNKDNTDLRRKYRVESEYSILNDDLREKDVKFESKKFKYNDGKLSNYEKTRQDRILENPEEYEAYRKGIERSYIDKQGTDNSYSNDYTNVARMWRYSDEVYKIYIEGMGTDSKKQDSQDGFAFGSGLTGIRARVRKACEEVAKNIQKERLKDPNIEIKGVTLDVFGFSRGAASARNFVYEVNKKHPYGLQKITIPDGYHPIDPYSEGYSSPKYRNAFGDSDQLEVDSSVLVNDQLPGLGHLGYSLLKDDIMSWEEISKLIITVRFVGVYDTVASYYEVGALGAYDANGNLKDDPKFTKLLKEAWSTHFKDDVDELHLNEGSFVKMVHLTAKDEHRRNFSLTRINQVEGKAIEKNLPGVHCDIGGAYENEMEYKDEIGTSLMDHDYKASFLSGLISPIIPIAIPMGLRSLKNDLVQQHWFKEDELEIKTQLGWIPPFTSYRKLSGTRFVRKEYSYLPLHFMQYYAKPLLDCYLKDDLTIQYNIAGHPLLEQAESYLQGYIENEIPEWDFVTDEQFEIRKRELVEKENLRRLNEELEKNRIYQEQNASGFEGQQQYWPTMPKELIPEPEEDIKTVDIEEVVVTGYHPHILLRKLRNQYFHWSSSRDWFGMEPDKNRQRRITKPGES